MVPAPAAAQDAGRGMFEMSGLELVFVIALILLSGFFSGAETAITTLWPWKVRELAEREGRRGPFHLLQLDITRFLTTILVANNLVNVAAAALVTNAATKAFGSRGIGYATGVVTVLLLFFGEITPKSIAVHNADRLARWVVYPIYALSVLFYPLGRVFTWTSARVLRLLRLEPAATPLVSQDELRLIVHGAEQSGSIEEDEQDMISNVLEMSLTQVEEVMVPRVDIVAIESSDTIDEFLTLVRSHRFSRLPVYREQIDHIVGVAYVKDLIHRLGTPDWRNALSLPDITQPAYFVPESKPISDLMVDMRRRKTHMAIVLDEFGGVAGLVTLEDIIEEIFGEIYDEHDKKAETDIEPQAGGGFLIRGTAEIDDVASALGVELAERGSYITLSGLLLDLLGRIPKQGEVVESQGFRFEIVEADDRRILRVRAHRSEPASGPTAAGTGG